MRLYFAGTDNRVRELSYKGAWSDSYDISGTVEAGTSLSSFRLIG